MVLAYQIHVAQAVGEQEPCGQAYCCNYGAGRTGLVKAPCKSLLLAVHFRELVKMKIREGTGPQNKNG